VPALPRPLLLGGFAGSVLLAVGGTGAGSLPRPAPGSWAGVEVLASSAEGLSVLLCALGAVILLACWWRLRRVLDDVAPRAVLRAAGLWSVPLLVGPPLASRDVYAYAAQAAITARGFDPYVLGPIEGGGAFSAHVDEVWRGTPSPYGPAYLWPASLLLRLTGSSVVGTVLALRLLAVLGLALTAWALVRLARAHGVPEQRALWLGVLNPLGLLHGVAGAHNDVLMVGLMLAGVAVGLGAAGRAPLLVAAGALVTTGALVKAPAAAALPVLVLAVAGWRERARAGALVGGGAAVVALTVPWLTGLGWGWVGTVDTGRTLLSLFSPSTGLASLVGAAAEASGLVADAATVRDPLLSAAALLAVLVAGALLLLTPRLGPVRALGLALLAVVVLSPTVLPWYLLWGVVPLAAVVGRRWADALGAACGALCLATQPSGRSLVRPPLYGLPLLAAGAAAAVALRAQRVPTPVVHEEDP
jgi:hypothetical protein